MEELIKLYKVNKKISTLKKCSINERMGNRAKRLFYNHRRKENNYNKLIDDIIYKRNNIKIAFGMMNKDNEESVKSEINAMFGDIDYLFLEMDKIKRAVLGVENE